MLVKRRPKLPVLGYHWSSVCLRQREPGLEGEEAEGPEGGLVYPASPGDPPQEGMS
jgi:hypothetical protein